MSGPTRRFEKSKRLLHTVLGIVSFAYARQQDDAEYSAYTTPPSQNKQMGTKYRGLLCVVAGCDGGSRPVLAL